jgi:hypothetical protein
LNSGDARCRDRHLLEPDGGWLRHGHRFRYTGVLGKVAERARGDVSDDFVTWL